MRIAIILLVLVGVAVFVAFRLVPRDRDVHRQPTVGRPDREPAPPPPSVDPGPRRARGDGPVPGSREDRARHGKP